MGDLSALSFAFRLWIRHGSCGALGATEMATATAGSAAGRDGAGDRPRSRRSRWRDRLARPRHARSTRTFHLAVGVLFLVAALQLAQRQPRGIERYGLALGGLLEPPSEAPMARSASLLDLVRAPSCSAVPSGLRELGFAAARGAGGVPTVHLRLLRVARAGPPVRAQPRRTTLPAYVLTQLLVVGLPEEALFRGYAQSRLHEAFKERVRVLGAELSLRALVLQAVLFALIHFAVEAASRAPGRLLAQHCSSAGCAPARRRHRRRARLPRRPATYSATCSPVGGFGDGSRKLENG